MTNEQIIRKMKDVLTKEELSTSLMLVKITYYEDDVNQLNDLGLNSISGYTWLASLLVASYSPGSHFYVCIVPTSAGLVNSSWCSIYSNTNVID